MKVDIKKNTDQLNYEDFLGGVTRTVTIAGVKRGAKEAQYDIAIEGDARFWRPPPTVLKLLRLAYGDESADWIGKSARLYGDPDVKMKGVKVGGIRVSHLSHIAKPLTASLTVTRGQSAIFTVEPLPDAAPTPTPPPENPERANLLAQIKEAATKASVDLGVIATEWAEGHGGQDIREATDIGGLELVRDDLNGRAS